MWTSSFLGDSGNLDLLLKWDKREKAGKVPTCSLELQGGLQSASRCVVIRNWNLMQYLVRYACRPFSWKDWKRLFLPALSALSPGRMVVGSAYAPIKNSLFTIFQWNLWMEASSASRARCLGICPLVGALKFGALYVQSKPLAPHEDGIPSWLYAAVSLGGIYGDSVSLPFLSVSIWVFSQLPDV